MNILKWYYYSLKFIRKYFNKLGMVNIKFGGIGYYKDLDCGVRATFKTNPIETILKIRLYFFIFKVCFTYSNAYLESKKEISQEKYFGFRIIK